MVKTLITGIYGFTGGHLAEYLAGLGMELYGLDLALNEPTSLDHLAAVSKIHIADVKNKNDISEIIHSIKPDYIFHLAGLITNADINDLFATNVIGTKNILDASLSFDIKILIPGSAAEYGAVSEDNLPVTESSPLCPVNDYGISKVAQTLLACQYNYNHGCQVHIVRPFNIIGPREPDSLVCSTIARQVVDIETNDHEPVIRVGNLETKRDFIDVRDVVKAYWAVINKGSPGEIYNVCSGKAYSIKDILSILLRISKVKVNVKVDRTRIRAKDIPIQIGENKKIKIHTGWFPEIEINKTLSDLLEDHKRRILFL